ncbi:AAA family ATPase [Erythrobacter arachoides]|uniref:AAA family ATPase n=1 Tax=Aurantiacibacter arachoides TaxID=1850444 RepID=A0A845A2I3_9SPHN|nr:AAA domain-containing protein [Aurantiacibacter arachoides]MXO94763.1 AAA family ATPase [Aurantiacibacter arachoides]GGD60879.1 very short patch repair endonuclease [Aurantiacibacter arachoides]
MTGNRPYMQRGINELEKLVEETRADPTTLRRVLAELSHRETDRAGRLRGKIKAMLDGLELPLAEPQTQSAVATEPELLGFNPNRKGGLVIPNLVGASRTALKAELKKVQSEKQSNSLENRPQVPETAAAAPIVEPVANPTKPRQPPSLVVSRMLDLIDYVIAVEKDKLKTVTDVGEHKGFHRTHDELVDLPGVSFNVIDGGEAAWLQVERLAKLAPPVPVDPLLATWVVLSDDPVVQPRLRESLSEAECKKAGIALEPDQPGIALIDLPQREDVETALASYVAGPWSAWSRQERPRRASIALYGNLFALQASLSAPDGTPQEFVCGIGYAGLSHDGKRLRYPLLTVPLEIELNRHSHVLSVIPREEVAPSAEVDPLDAMGFAQVDAWRKDARRTLDGLEDDPLSPFAPGTYDRILGQAAALLDSRAQYHGGGGAGFMPPPTPGPELIITNAFGFFQRERRATQLMADLLAFKELLEDGGDMAIPGSIAALFTEPSTTVASEDFPTFRGINSIPGFTSSDGGGDDLFFPKPFNGEQVQIVQRLAVRDGVVVQGPPGTGKTHTIANIISHYLATGRRVLVTSQKSPALQVLQGQLPAAIRPLAVSLLDSDREGLKQFRGSVDLIAERLQGLRKSDLDDEIAGLGRQIDGLHQTLAQIDHEIDRLGRTALEPVTIDGQVVAPLDAALEVLNAGDDALWIEDAITPASAHDAAFANDDIASIRQARATLGVSLDYLGKELPPADLFADIEGIVATHLDLVRASSIDGEISDGIIWALADDWPETVDAVSGLCERLSTWTLQRDQLRNTATAWESAAHGLLASPADPLLLAIQGMENEARALASDHAWFLTRPVQLPDGALDDPRFLAAIDDLQNGGQGLGTLAGLFARKTKQYLDAVRLCAKAPKSAEDWQTVARFISASDRATALISSWNHAIAGTGLPANNSTGPAAGREIVHIMERIEEIASVQGEAAHLTRDLRRLLPHWPGIITQENETSPVLNCLHLHLDRARLRKAETNRQSLLARLGTHETEIHGEMRLLVANLGQERLAASTVRDEAIALARRAQRLHGHRPHFDVVAAVSEKIQNSGAARWATRLRSEPATGEDPLCLGDWHKRWRLRRLASWLDASQKLDQFRTLHGNRQQAESDLSRSYTRMIEQRTWLALKKQASPAIMAALSAYAVAVGKIGKGTGKSANRHRKSARSAANAVKGALPCWIMPHHRVSESLPPELAIFDLVIVDEASQSTLSGLPALFRARQILVVGDDKQVSPDNVGLSMDQADARAARYLASQVSIFNAPMREENSLYDLAKVVFGGDKLMLREHFRCAAPIIEFSKRQFYDNELRPLRLSKASERLDPALIDVRVKTGFRKGKTNPAEADFIVSELSRMADDPAFDGRTLGVTTLLGTEQAALIYNRILGELGIPFIEKYHVRVGDPSVFQGDERDVMFLSMVATPGNATALSGLAFEQRFNVAASRARERMILVRSIDLEQLSPKDALRRALLEHFRSPFPVDTFDQREARTRCESDFEREMFDELSGRGYSIDTQVRVGAHRIDLVIEGDEDRRLAIECDGDRYHGPEQWPADMTRQRTLERAGWRIWRCFASRFVRDRAEVLSELTDLLTALDIHPRQTSERSRTYTEYREWPDAASDTDPVNSPVPEEFDLHLGDGLVEDDGSHDHPEDSPLLFHGDAASSPAPLQDHHATRTTEREVQAAILDLMQDGNVWTNAGLKAAIPAILALTVGDREMSLTRPKEEKWEELVNNALSEHGRSNSLYARGLLSKVGHGQHRLKR